VTVSTKKAIGDRRGHLSIRRRRLAGSTASEMSQIADTAWTRSRALAERHASIKAVSVEVREAPAGTTFSAAIALDCADDRDERRGHMIRGS
jgi:hypothetical protein